MKLFKSNNNYINKFLSKNPVNINFSEAELNVLYALSLIEEKYNINLKSLIEDSVCKTCIFKVENTWIVWDTDEVGRYFYKEVFTNAHDACKNTIDRHFLRVIRLQKQEENVNKLLLQWTAIIDEFDNLCLMDYEKETLEAYAANYGFNIQRDNNYVLQKTR